MGETATGAATRIALVTGVGRKQGIGQARRAEVGCALGGQRASHSSVVCRVCPPLQGCHGRIINLTAGQFQRPMPTEVAYAVTKGAIDALTRAIAPTLASRDITVNAVNPGPTDTGWLNAAVKETLRQRFPAGRVGLPQDAAQLVAFLASEAANWITGRILHSEGGVD
jgi:NAD(P)-dependent dehydrogenase (short-subunit alcohol dehydrogenase family)